MFLLDGVDTTKFQSLEELRSSHSTEAEKVAKAVEETVEYMAQFRADSIVQDAEEVRDVLLLPTESDVSLPAVQVSDVFLLVFVRESTLLCACDLIGFSSVVVEGTPPLGLCPGSIIRWLLHHDIPFPGSFPSTNLHVHGGHCPYPNANL